MHPQFPMVDPLPDQSLDSYSPTRTAFSDAARQRIRRICAASNDKAHDRLDDAIRAAATICAREAREAGARAEQFVVVLKREWSGAADAGGVARQRAMELATRLVSAAIVEFYRAE